MTEPVQTKERKWSVGRLNANGNNEGKFTLPFLTVLYVHIIHNKLVF